MRLAALLLGFAFGQISAGMTIGWYYVFVGSSLSSLHRVTDRYEPNRNQGGNNQPVVSSEPSSRLEVMGIQHPALDRPVRLERNPKPRCTRTPAEGESCKESEARLADFSKRILKDIRKFQDQLI
jgi:hypothetical protein